MKNKMPLNIHGADELPALQAYVLFDRECVMVSVPSDETETKLLCVHDGFPTKFARRTKQKRSERPLIRGHAMG